MYNYIYNNNNYHNATEARKSQFAKVLPDSPLIAEQVMPINRKALKHSHTTGSIKVSSYCSKC